ncbi:hypothetical protein HYH03_009508 [Edaphochlamys debaryana]|uniref:Uncharacterized protein n=1 Tax=Edaphochlamys debaryana TaxID=47281 RepID=A0A836BYG1_9CHLO|nr:hypothetical protein HYH03_009508 [Edaphochlamys debaryana]|eukprot:KAG2492268.1 hypothetical protein HYH03_009508 [Edaphochlamys debaryana]
MVVVAPSALYNFADSAEERIPGQRRNRSTQKKEARSVLDVVRGLTSMSAKQLGAVSHLLPPGGMEAVGIAAKLPRSNQGRKRQEALVAKMLRGQLTDPQIEKLQEAVSIATQSRGIFEDGDVSGLVESWREGLLGEDQEVIAEVYGYPVAWAPDHQQLRSLVRQCKEALEEEEQQRQAAEALVASDQASPTGSSSGSDGEGGESGGEGAAEAAAEAAADAAAVAGGPPRRRKGGKAPEPKSRPLVRSLGKLLKPLALRVVAERDAQA